MKEVEINGKIVKYHCISNKERSFFLLNTRVYKFVGRKEKYFYYLIINNK